MINLESMSTIDMESPIDGVYVLSLDFELGGEVRQIHPVAIETETGLILVDIGHNDSPDAVEAELESAGFDLADVELIVMTHQDIDHAGGLQEIRHRVNAPVLAHESDAPFIRGDEELIKAAFGTYPPARVDVEVVGGVVLDTMLGPLHVLETPGHTPGHISLYHPTERFLIAGDALTADGEINGPNRDFTPDLQSATDSVANLASRDIERTLCYHGGFVEHGPDRIEEIHDKMSEEIST